METKKLNLEQLVSQWYCDCLQKQMSFFSPAIDAIPVGTDSNTLLNTNKQ